MSTLAQRIGQEFKTLRDDELSPEIAARIAADSDLNASITAEGAARVAADSDLNDLISDNAAAISTEVTARGNADSDLAALISDEVVARSNADSDLEAGKVDKIDITAGSVGSTTEIPVITYNEQGQITSVSTAEIDMETEANARIAADSDLDAAITAEITARGNADSDLYATVTNDISIAIANLVDVAPSTLDTLNELAAALGDDANFSTTVTNMVAAVDSDLTVEIAARIAADSAEQSARITAVSVETNARIAADSALDSALEAETLARQNADSDLLASVNTLAANYSTTAEIDSDMLVEATARANADSDLDAAITAESLARAAADSDLANDISDLQATVASGSAVKDAFDTLSGLDTLTEGSLVEGWMYGIRSTNTVYVYAPSASSYDYQPDGWTGGFIQFVNIASIQNIVDEEAALRAAADSDLTDAIAAAVAAADLDGVLSAGNTSTREMFVGNITTTGYLRGPSTFVIDPATHGDDTGTLRIAGNLQVDGTTTTINSTAVSIDDLTFVLADNAASASQANGGGIIVGDNYGSFLFNEGSGTPYWETNIGLAVGGNLMVETINGQDMSYYRIDVYNNAGTLLN